MVTALAVAAEEGGSREVGAAGGPQASTRQRQPGQGLARFRLHISVLRGAVPSLLANVVMTYSVGSSSSLELPPRGQELLRFGVLGFAQVTCCGSDTG